MTLAGVSAMSCRWATGYEVIRRADGREHPGRYVSYQAYSLYARGALLEASGDLSGAATSYGLALEEDDSSVELWTRLGKLRCQLKLETYEEAFAQAESFDPDYAPLWSARALCAALRGDAKRALAAAQRALELDPLSLSVALLVAERFEALGQIDDAARHLDAATLLHNRSLGAAKALFDFAQRQEDPVLQRLASERLTALWPAAGHDVRVISQLSPLTTRQPDRLARANRTEELTRALFEGQLDRARRIGVEMAWTQSEIALHAVRLGASAAGLAQALWVLRSDPENPNAWIAGLVAADLLRDPVSFDRLLKSVPKNRLAMSAQAKELFRSLLERRVGDEAAGAWQASHSSPPASSGPPE